MSRNRVGDLRGGGRLAVEATRGVADLVQAMHRRIAGPFALLSAPAYAGVRGVASLVGAGLDGLLARLAPLAGDAPGGPEREALVAALNGVLGDHLEATGNPLAIRMEVRRGGQAIALGRKAISRAIPGAGSRILVAIHGSSLSDLQWRRNGHDHAERLAAVGYTPVYLHYNSGLHVSVNGRALAELLEELVGAWPTRVSGLSLLGHSMGGLVARGACHAGAVAGHRWLARLRDLVCLGTPHHGAPLERYGNLLGAALGVSSYSAPLARLGRIRSAGVTDLRFGNVRDEDWQAVDRFELGGDRRVPTPLPEGVRCFAVAGTLSRRPGARPRGDGLVSVASALGRHRRPEMTLGFPESRTLVAPGTGHLDLLDGGPVYRAIEAWLSPGRPAGRTAGRRGSR
jgi:hypothetical protein